MNPWIAGLGALLILNLGILLGVVLQAVLGRMRADDGARGSAAGDWQRFRIGALPMEGRVQLEACQVDAFKRPVGAPFLLSLSPHVAAALSQDLARHAEAVSERARRSDA